GEPSRNAAFLCRLDGGAYAGFAEAAMRTDYVNGCETSPVAFLEAVFVERAHRRKGIARALCGAVEAWARQQGCREFASDADIANRVSHRMHAALGFAETDRVVLFSQASRVRPRVARGLRAQYGTSLHSCEELTRKPKPPGSAIGSVLPLR